MRFFGRECARDLVAEGRRPDLIAANNVMAHVPDLNDFVAGFEMLLADDGVVTIEVAYLLRLIEANQFDTIYHEHFQYFSCLTAQRVLAKHGLELFDVEELKSHGGSLRLFAQRKSTGRRPVGERVHELTARERALGYDTLDGHLAFTTQVEETKWSLLEFLIAERREGKHIAGYGAPGKGNTLLNYCGIRTDLLDYTVDRNPYKQGQFLPGTHIPIRPPEALTQTSRTISSSCRGTSRTRSRTRSVHARLGRAVRRADPPRGGARVDARGTDALGSEAYALMERLYPLCRSLTGRRGARDVRRDRATTSRSTLTRGPRRERTSSTGPSRESGTSVTPGRRAGRQPHHRLPALARCMSSATATPLRARMPLEELRTQLYRCPSSPTVIPYRTSYYHRDLGLLSRA